MSARLIPMHPDTFRSITSFQAQQTAVEASIGELQILAHLASGLDRSAKAQALLNIAIWAYAVYEGLLDQQPIQH